MKPLKDIYTSAEVFQELARDMKKVYPRLNEAAFSRALTEKLEKLEIKGRIERAADVCHQFLPKDYPKALEILYAFTKGKENRLVYLFLPSFVAKYGQAHYSQSIKAIRDFTEYSSSEFGVRAFIEKKPDKTLAVMKEWAVSKNVHIRRLASEGCRPRLPWSKKIPRLIQKPEQSWKILEILKTDPEKYVQKSVANHINDISKDHPDWIVGKVRQWDLSNGSTGWIVRHGMRTLIKKGHRGALSLFGMGQKPQVRVDNIKWDKKTRLGGSCELIFSLVSKSQRPQSLVVDYHLFFCKKNGRQSPKTFKLKQYTLAPKETVTLKTKYVFKNRTTRKHYPGTHAWQLMINGTPLETYSFEVR